MPPAFEVLLLNTAVPQIQAAQAGDTYVVPRDIAFSAALTLSAGTANGVPYLNASKVLTTGSALTFDGTNFLVGVASLTPPSVGTTAPWANVSNGNNGALLLGPANTGTAFLHDNGGDTVTTIRNLYASTSANAQLRLQAGFLTFHAGTALSEQMRLTSTGLGIGTSSPVAKLHSNNSSSGATALTAIFGNGAAAALNNGSAIFLNNSSSFNASTYSARIASVITNASTQASDLVFGLYNGNQNNDLMRLDSSGNLLLNGTSAGASAVGTLAIFNGTAPTGSVTDGIILYAEDVSSSSELKVRDEAGNVTTLSPHNFSLIPEGPSEDMAWAYYSEKGGKRINVDMLKLARMVEKLTGEKLVYEN